MELGPWTIDGEANSLTRHHWRNERTCHCYWLVAIGELAGEDGGKRKCAVVVQVDQELPSPAGDHAQRGTVRCDKGHVRAGCDGHCTDMNGAHVLLDDTLVGDLLTERGTILRASSC